MKFSENWLREWVNPALSTEQLCHLLTMGGLEVDAIENVAPEHSGVVVGQIIEANQHPNADKLQVCLVDVGNKSEEKLQIVCGASNARVGIKVACAMINAVLPGNFKIKKSKLRGELSFGMLCSAKELGLGEGNEGIIELAEDAPLGVSINDYYQLNDKTIELGITPNRSDCLSIEGVAREAAVLSSTPFNAPEIKQDSISINDVMGAVIDAKEDCPRYCCQIIKGIKPNVSSPLWLVERLRRSDIRSISLLVDISNYVMLEMGQPMHIFDLDKLSGSIVVRSAKEGENLELLDGQTIKLNSEHLVIADQKQALALAGIMGGLSSSVTETTSNILIESAYFAPEKLAGKARSLGLHTDSSHRFERGVSPQLQERAIYRAAELICQIAGGDVGPISSLSATEYLPLQMQKDAAICFNMRSVEKLLGIALTADEIKKMFIDLQMQVEEQENHWLVTPPAFRFDIQYEVDLIEEVARLYGYDNLPSSQLLAPITMSAKSEEVLSLSSLKQCLVDLDYQEVINYSFVDPKLHQYFRKENQQSEDSYINLTNPISEDLSQMRSTLWQGLIKSLLHNQNRQQARIRLFETGSCFFKENSVISEIDMLAGIICGRLFPEQWGQDNKQLCDFFDLKGDVEKILSLGGNLAHYQFVAAKHPALHPGQTAEIIYQQQPIGWIGTLHPELAKNLQVKQQTILFELKVDEVLKSKIPKFNKISKFPAIRRDIAIIVDKSCASQDLLTTIREKVGNILIDVILFDTYTSSQLESDKKSLAIGLLLQDESKTLTDEEIDQLVEQVLTVLKTQFGAKLRD